MALTLEYGCSKRGQRTLLYEGHEYWRKHENAAGQIIWRCCKHQSVKCSATMKTAGEHVITKPGEHNHEGNIQKSEAKAAVQEMKKYMTNTVTTPSASQAAVTVQLNDAVHQGKKTTGERRELSATFISSGVVEQERPCTGRHS